MLSLDEDYKPENPCPENPCIESSGEKCVRLSWMGGPCPKAVNGMCVSYCKGGMMLIGAMQTPVRYCHIVENTHGKQVMELQISADVLATLQSPAPEPLV
jgi:hypothetical protein